MSEQCLHASCVSVAGRGILLMGKSGTGKSNIALSMIALGADFVADDQVILHRESDSLIATCPATIRGKIEARGVGLLSIAPIESTRVVLAVDLDQQECDRLPSPRLIELLDRRITLFRKPSTPNLAAILYVTLLHGPPTS